MGSSAVVEGRRYARLDIQQVAGDMPGRWETFVALWGSLQATVVQNAAEGHNQQKVAEEDETSEVRLKQRYEINTASRALLGGGV